MHQEGGHRHAIAYGLVNAELEAVDAGLRTLFSVQSGLAMTAVYEFGSPEQIATSSRPCAPANYSARSP